jgi:MoaA/NifB/PqqE/SkfB family radical SAM enzyme
MDRKLDGTKAIWHMDRVINHYEEDERIPPVHIDMGITKFCNIGCVFCYGKYQNPKPVMIKRDVLLNTMKEMGECNVRSVGIIGDGEPTCNPALYDALYVGKENGLDLAVSTNGVLLEDDYKRSSFLDNLTWMRFCISAGTREGYEKIHQVDRFDRVRKNIADLVHQKYKRGSDLDIGLQAVFVPTLMAEEMVEEAKLAVDLGVDYFVIKQCSLPDEGQTGMMNFDLNEYDKPEIIDSLKRAESYSNDQTKIIVKWDTIKNKGKKDYNGCKAVPLISEISGNGDWYVGCMFGNPIYDEFKFGNLHDKSFKEILNSDRYWDIIEKFKNYDVHNSLACKGACRLDPVNKFLDDYLNKPKGINFI